MGNLRFSRVNKRSVVLDGHKTSISLEDCFWHGLKRLSVERREDIGDTILFITAQFPGNRGSVLRQFLFQDLRARALTVPSSPRASVDPSAAAAVPPVQPPRLPVLPADRVRP